MENNNEVKKDDKLINHIRNIKLLQAIHTGKKFFVECYFSDEGARQFPNSNLSIKEIELPNFELYEEKLGYKWMKIPTPKPVEAKFHVVEFAGFFTIKTEPFYDSGKDILNAEEVGYGKAKENAELIVNFLNKHYAS